MTAEDRFVRINGGLLQSHVGKTVCLVGQFMSVDKIGRMIKIKLTDDVVIMVAFDNVLTQTFELDQYVQVRGTLENRNKLKGSNVFAFSKEQTENFDRELYNEMIALTFEHKEHFNVSQADYEVHYGASDPGPNGENIQAIKVGPEDSGDEPISDMDFNIDSSFTADFGQGAGF